MYTSMSKLVNLSDGVYAELTRLKKVRGESYSEVVGELLNKRNAEEKTLDWDDILPRLQKRASSYKGKREKTDHDLVAYGVSRDGS